ncbi:MAG: AzlD domain-containing protein [Eubacterium sp.]|nr:AzlD domain-containing protein [Eubacterium sp.]
MNSQSSYAMLLIAVMAGITILLRTLPFLIFSDKEHTPRIISWLGEVLPYAMIAMLVVYCLKDVDLAAKTHGLPEGIAALSVILLQWRKRNSILSILAGTVVYMVLLRIL